LRAQAAAAGMTDQLVFAGERADVGDLLPAFDVFVLPSKTEGRSIALLEAAATGLPLVVTAVGGNTEIVSDEVTGLVIPSGDAGGLTGAILRLLGDRPLRQRLGAAAAGWVRSHAAVEVMRDQYDALYRAALAALLSR
jgi:glycosyltransferase involved in cell wall biosynthesis